MFDKILEAQAKAGEVKKRLDAITVTGTAEGGKVSVNANGNKQILSINIDEDLVKEADKEQLEEACWNGLLPEIFPEIFRESTDLKSLYLWQIKQAQSFLEIEMGETPASKDYYFSIDPYCFLKQQYLS